MLFLGRRRISITWSPEKTPTNTPATKTPTKSTTMTLRSSPRKRLLLNEYNSTTPEKLQSPRKPINTSPSSSPQSQKLYPSSKRLRFDIKPLAQSQTAVPLNVLLKGLNNEQLIEIIQGLVQDQPQIEETIREKLPMPDLKPLDEQLNAAKKNIFKSLPTSRLIKKTDSTGYSRAAVHLTVFKKIIIDQCRLFNDSHHWDALLDYVQMAWRYVQSTPVWDAPAHNAPRKHCFKILSFYALAALKFGGCSLGEPRLTEFSTRMSDMMPDCEDLYASKEILNSLLEMY